MTPTIDQLRHRRSKRDLLREFFLANLGRPLTSAELHIRFGSSLRTRISEINAEERGPLRIRNHTSVTAGGEVSTYTASLHESESLFGDISPDRTYRE